MKIVFHVLFLTFFYFFIIYNNYGDCMKKYIGSIVLSILVGVYLGKFMLNQYDDLTVFSVGTEANTLFFLEAGVFQSSDEMKNHMSNFSYYIYNIDNDGIHAYIGITKNKKNALKIKEYWKEKSYDIYVREIGISNQNFVDVISEYDKLLDQADGVGIEDICGQVLSSYEELVINEN